MREQIKLKLGEPETLLRPLVEKKCKCKCAYLKILKKSLDARDKNNIFWLYTVEAYASKPEIRPQPLSKVKHPPKYALVAGTGPAGLFCAVRLVERGILPIVLERGGTVDERAAQNENFFKNKMLDENCNVQFGEGGAGTFSDGKLNTQTNSPLNKEVLETFVRFGAPEEILYLNKPHIGSDRLRSVVKNMRAYLLENGGKVLFHTHLTDVVSDSENNRIKAVKCRDLKNGDVFELPAEVLVLAIGHSSRDTFSMLKERGVKMEPRQFAVGVRIEHLQEKIGFSQYGENYKKLPAADYKLVSHAGARTAFTFCMCPGGYVMPASSEKGGVVTNGMSDYARDGQNANSALLVQIDFGDYDRGDVLDGVRFQRELEQRAFRLGGETYAAPVQRLADFIAGKKSRGAGEVLPTYAAGVTYTDLNALFPQYVNESLKAAVYDMDKRLRGFADGDALLTGAETRFSSPVRILRSENLESVSLEGIFPCGEGSGYSGGITSSAADGLRVAEKIAEKYNEH